MFVNVLYCKPKLVLNIKEINRRKFLYYSCRDDAIQHYICKNKLDKKEIADVYHSPKSKVQAITIDLIRVFINLNYHMETTWRTIVEAHMKTIYSYCIR